MFLTQCNRCGGVFSVETNAPNQTVVCYHCNTRQMTEKIWDPAAEHIPSGTTEMPKVARPSLLFAFIDFIAGALSVLGVIGVIAMIGVAASAGQFLLLFGAAPWLALTGFGCLLFCLTDVARSARKISNRVPVE